MTNEIQKEDIPVDLQSELHHFDDLLRAYIASYPETGPDKQQIIERAAISLEAAKQRFYVLNQQQGSGPDQEDPELGRLIESVHQSFRALDMRENGDGPALA